MKMFDGDVSSLFDNSYSDIIDEVNSYNVEADVKNNIDLIKKQSYEYQHNVDIEYGNYRKLLDKLKNNIKTLNSIHTIISDLFNSDKICLYDVFSTRIGDEDDPDAGRSYTKKYVDNYGFTRIDYIDKSVIRRSYFMYKMADVFATGFEYDHWKYKHPDYNICGLNTHYIDTVYFWDIKDKIENYLSNLIDNIATHYGYEVKNYYTVLNKLYNKNKLDDADICIITWILIGCKNGLPGVHLEDNILKLLRLLNKLDIVKELFNTDNLVKWTKNNRKIDIKNKDKENDDEYDVLSDVINYIEAEYN